MRLAFALNTWMECGGDNTLPAQEAQDESKKHIEASVNMFKEVSASSHTHAPPPPPPVGSLSTRMCLSWITVSKSGADPGFSFRGGGGGAKDYVRAHTSRARIPKSITARVQGSLRAMEALRVFYALLCYLSLMLKHSDTKWDKKYKKTVDQTLGGRAPDAPPSKSATVKVILGFLKFYFVFYWQIGDLGKEAEASMTKAILYERGSEEQKEVMYSLKITL